MYADAGLELLREALSQDGIWYEDVDPLMSINATDGSIC